MRDEDKNIVICGHVKHGKSTFTGRLLFETGAVTTDDIARAWKEIQGRPEYKDNAKDFNEFQALTLLNRWPTFGSSTEPDDQSRTEFPGRARVKSPHGTYTLIDNPGQDNYIDNTVYGIYLADFGILVVSANEGVEEGTERVARIMEGLETPLLAVCISKMDLVGYSKKKFAEVKEQVEDRILNKYFHRRARIPIIPVSALEGFGFRMRDKERKPDDPLGWYHEKSIGELLGRAEREDEELSSKPVRITVEGRREVYAKAGIGTVIVGSLESGTVKQGDVLALAPVPRSEPRTVKVRSIRRPRTLTDERTDALESLSARALVSLAVSVDDTEALKRNLVRGAVFAPAAKPATVAQALRARIVFFDREVVHSAKQFQLHAHGQRVPCKIVSIDDLAAGDDQTKTFPGEIIKASVNLEIPISIESVSHFRRLSRFVLRFEYRIVACGVCIEARGEPFPRRLFRSAEERVAAREHA